jgi:hypothetical protein
MADLTGAGLGHYFTDIERAPVAVQAKTPVFSLVRRMISSNPTCL